MKSANEMQSIRAAYAEELRAVSNLRSDALVKAFATVSREHYLGPGPWQILNPPALGSPTYRTTDDADPRRLYHNVLVAIDPARGLNNGEPGSLAFWLDALDIKVGERVVHIGCGVGYYTAILAEVVQASGHVTGFEVDTHLAARSQRNLSHLTQVTVTAADGSQLGEGSSDVVFVNAGATHPRVEWLDALRPNGRLLVPLTFTAESTDQNSGGMLKITRKRNGYSALFTSWVGIFPCAGARDPQLNEKLVCALRGDSLKQVRSLRRDRHPADEACWLHGEHFCLSMHPLEHNDAR